MSKAVKAIGIARQSKGDDKSKSIEDQSQAIRDYCKSKGYALSGDGRLTPVPEQAVLVRDAYRMRARGDSLEAIRAHLGVRYASVVSRLLANEVYLGVVRHGALVNLEAHDAIIDGALFRK